MKTWKQLTRDKVFCSECRHSLASEELPMITHLIRYCAKSQVSEGSVDFVNGIWKEKPKYQLCSRVNPTGDCPMFERVKV